MIKTCECCNKIINPLIVKDEIIDDIGIYYEDDNCNICYCEDCGNEELTWSSDIGYYVYNDEYKENYSDDELSDIIIFNKWDVCELDAVTLESEELDYDRCYIDMEKKNENN